MARPAALRSSIRCSAELCLLCSELAQYADSAGSLGCLVQVTSFGAKPAPPLRRQTFPCSATKATVSSKLPTSSGYAWAASVKLKLCQIRLRHALRKPSSSVRMFDCLTSSRLLMTFDATVRLARASGSVALGTKRGTHHRPQLFHLGK